MLSTHPAPAIPRQRIPALPLFARNHSPAYCNASLRCLSPLQGAVYGGADVPLSTNGEAEARAAAAMIHAGVPDGVPVFSVFCSPLARAVYGAARVAEACGLRDGPTPLEGLREVGRGEWYGMTPAGITERHGAGWQESGTGRMAATARHISPRPPCRAAGARQRRRATRVAVPHARRSHLLRSHLLETSTDASNR